MRRTPLRRTGELPRTGRLHRRQPSPACVQTGSVRGTGACLGSRSGGCRYCGVPDPDERLRLEALLDERAQLAVEGWR